MGAPWLAVVAPYVLEGLPIGLYIADTGGLLVHANGAALDILGVRATSELDGTTLATCRVDGAGGELPYGVVEIAGRDGVRRTVEHQPVSLGSPTLAGELTCGLLRQVTDPVERADLESRRLMDLGGITRRVAHDLNNMLVAVLGYAHLLAEDTSEPNAEVRQILLAAQRARELTGQILGYVGRPEQGFRDVDLSHMVEQTARLFEISVPKQVRVRFELTADLPPVRGEPTRLRQVIMNLIINAAEAVGSGGGEIVIRTDCITDSPLPVPFAAERDRLPSREYGLVEVRDDGHGMDEETVRRAFEPFFTSKPEGRGLGLATVAEILAEHHGAILLDTAVGKGAAFRVLFPLGSRGRRAPASAARSQPTAPVAIRRGHMDATVLVVDEEDLVRGMAATALKRAGFNVLEAGDAQEAMDVLGQEAARVDLILLDLQIDEQDGISVVRTAREICPDAQVVYCTGAHEDRPDESAGLGFSAVLRKPYTPTGLISQIDALLGLTD